MDLGWLTSVNLDFEFWSSLMSIIIINLILSGDNAVVIALAVRSLPREQRLKSIVVGSGAAVVLRVVLTFFAIQLLTVPFLKIVGGILIVWIAIKLFLEDASDDGLGKEVTNFFQALRTILVADLVMSLDNVVAVAAVAKGSMLLLIIGLALSVPLVVGTSTFLLKLMDRFPIIITIGAAILGKVGGEMIISDPVVIKMFNPSKTFSYGVELFFVVGVLVAGKLIARWKIQREERALS